MQTNDSTQPAVLSLSQVDVISSFDSGQVEVENVNWNIRSGDFWVIGGFNATGKSNLLATAACLQRPGKGSVCIFGNDTARFHASELQRERLRIGIVFKDGGRLFSRLSVFENITLPLCYQNNWMPGEAVQAIEPLIQATGLSDYLHANAESLAPSWQQRVALARALALKPEVLLLDEPTVGMDTRHRRWWQDFLEQLSHGILWTGNQPLTLALTTHDFERWTPHQNRRFTIVNEKQWHILADPEEIKKYNPSENK